MTTWIVVVAIILGVGVGVAVGFYSGLRWAGKHMADALANMTDRELTDLAREANSRRT